MNINPSDIQLTPKLQIAIAHYAALEGKTCEEVLADRFPLLEEPTEEQLSDSLKMCDQGMADAAAGKGTEAREAIADLAGRLGLKPNE